VADGHLPLALGSQTAGSILRPASYCGVIGFKPTFGDIPLAGVLEQSPPLDTLGGYARSVADVALLTWVLSGRPLTRPRLPDRPLRFAFVKTRAWPDGDAAMRAAFESLAQRHRGLVEEVALPDAFADTGGLQRAVQFRDIARNYGPIADRHPGVLSAKLVEVIAEGRTVGDEEYEAACARRAALTAALGPVFAAFDVILTPAAPGIAPLGLGSTGSPMFNFLWTYLGCPAISLPLLQVEGLPLGVQLVGARGEDARLLAVAEAALGALR
jgi:Asp-tRNA(Asn)/Glu-tRNA(Gln) amidotransferase A subunit family amidase